MNRDGYVYVVSIEGARLSDNRFPVYVGRTKNPRKRINEHLFGTSNLSWIIKPLRKIGVNFDASVVDFGDAEMLEGKHIDRFWASGYALINRSRATGNCDIERNHTVSAIISKLPDENDILFLSRVAMGESSPICLSAFGLTDAEFFVLKNFFEDYAPNQIDTILKQASWLRFCLGVIPFRRELELLIKMGVDLTKLSKNTAHAPAPCYANGWEKYGRKSRVNARIPYRNISKFLSG